MRLVTTFIQNTESTDPDLSYLNRARFVLSVADGHGSDGVGILDAVIRNRHLFLSMTSGAEIDAGSVFTEDDLPVASDSRYRRVRPGLFFHIGRESVATW